MPSIRGASSREECRIYFAIGSIYFFARGLGGEEEGAAFFGGRVEHAFSLERAVEPFFWIL